MLASLKEPPERVAAAAAPSASDMDELLRDIRARRKEFEAHLDAGGTQFVVVSRVGQTRHRDGRNRAMQDQGRDGGEQPYAP